MSATQTSLYNGALRLCGARKLASLSENNEPRRLLDAAWGSPPSDGAIKYCLEMGNWTFAARTVQLDYDPSIAPSFGFRYVFEQPTDLVRVCGIWQDEGCAVPLLQYTDERRYWYSNLQTIYVKYVSSLAQYGLDYSLWPESFVKTVEAFLANEIVLNLTQDKQRLGYVAGQWKECVSDAKSLDAAKNPTQFMPQGSWTGARMNGSSRSHYRGERF